ncbi:flavin reductase (DIM6/NTAB) family NADH-FMN oxidoreductase RutF [Mumia flava]|uniref:Flavin reductase (DIM6/NTAB) family NADH-FMN oxidoreductase RutF n=2 Tax=Mumia flava TaxID=1348852 RepID=A0A2M9BEQ1_9ACTN|nr:flavin reductase (DIM6/NTAB) family NADH-FMN oxidoreductase RutF [Mumia flava]
MFRDVLAQWPSGVTVVTTVVDGVRHGMTASSFSSVSLDPPLVSICLDRKLYSHGLVERGGVFGISVLAKDQADVARRFAGMTDAEDRFAGESWSTASTGVPLLDSALGWLDCRVVHAYPGGDHTIFVGEVLSGRAARRTAPLLFHSRGWGQFADVLPDVATLADSGLVPSLLQHGQSGEEVRRTAHRVRRSGIRVRVADLTGTASLENLAWHDGPSRPGDGRIEGSALVESRLQARQAADRGVSVLETRASARDLRSVRRACDLLGHFASTPGADQRVVVLSDVFADERVDETLAAIDRLLSADATEVCLDDTTGSATPLQVRALLQDSVGLARPVPLRLRLRDNDRLGLVNVLTALKSGVHHFDTTLGGLDGAVATEDLVRLLGTLDVTTPVDPSTLDTLVRQVRERVSRTSSVAVGSGLTTTDPAPLPTL